MLCLHPPCSRIISDLIFDIVVDSVALLMFVVVRSRVREHLAGANFRPLRDLPPRLEPLLRSHLVKLGPIDSS